MNVSSGGGVLDFEAALYSGGYKIITENYSATGLLQIWAKGVKDVTVQWFNQQLRRLSVEGDPLVGVSMGYLLQHTHINGFYSTQNNPPCYNTETANPSNCLKNSYDL